MQLGIFAKTFEGTDAATVLAAVKAAGYGATQFNMACLGLPSMPDAIAPEAAASVTAAVRETGIAVVAVSGTYNMIHPDPAVRATGLARLEVLAAASAGLGTGLVTLCTGTRDAHDQWRHHPDNASPEAWRDLLVEMTKAAAIAERYGIDLGIEPELANVVSSAPLARRLIDEVASPRLKIVLDPANLFEVASRAEQQRLVAGAIDLLADRIAMGHAKDRGPEGDFRTAGTGVLDYDFYLTRLAATGFDGPLITHGLAAHEAAGVAAFLSAKLAAIGAGR
ncbi:sugar phosphate isomerase/epimerase family protein [Segnochrobactrum spirostomi]|uniref:Sugar phosphate isomerase/epimerase n=1 Tax=Segnochrobactrum spirostomi TaxID=2608987 RepID=A0A6A7XZV7_9HYPH|nr:sugar phosphate isomerase/epimerase [Segnochrobactrum spirostomi]MQT11876.1 sugar phosphate isomerase/epimerase [Segnochrobactrum spirostomi]